MNIFKNLWSCLVFIVVNVYVEAKWHPLRAVSCVLLFTIVFLLSGRADAQLQNWPPTHPAEVAKFYETGQLVGETVRRFDRRSSFVCDLLLLPDSSVRIVVFDNATNVVKVYLMTKDGEVKFLWERISI